MRAATEGTLRMSALGGGIWVFVYGTLRDPEVFSQVAGHPPDEEPQPAVLKGFGRRHFRDLPYDYIEPALDEEVAGLVIPVRPMDLEALDIYEDATLDGGDLYRRISVRVQVAHAGERTAFVYVVGEGRRALGLEEDSSAPTT